MIILEQEKVVVNIGLDDMEVVVGELLLDKESRQLSLSLSFGTSFSYLFSSVEDAKRLRNMLSQLLKSQS